MNLIRVLARSAAIEGLEGLLCRCLKLLVINRGAVGPIIFGEFRRKPAGTPPEYHQIRQRIAAQPIRAVQSLSLIHI